jgi:hypothetical protein
VGLKKGEKAKMLFLVPKLPLGNGIMPQALLGTSLFYVQPHKIGQIFRQEGPWQVVPKRELGNQDVKGEKPELSSAPGYPGEAQGNNRAGDFVE